jgi:hypothetical protein
MRFVHTALLCSVGVPGVALLDVAMAGSWSVGGSAGSGGGGPMAGAGGFGCVVAVVGGAAAAADDEGGGGGMMAVGAVGVTDDMG